MTLKQTSSKALTALVVAAATTITVPLAPQATAKLSAQAQPQISTTTAASEQNPQPIRTFGSGIINSDGQVLATVEGSFFKPPTSSSPIQILNPQTGKLLQTLKGTNQGFPAAISASGQTLVSRLLDTDVKGYTKTVALKIWDLKTGTLLRTLPVEPNSTETVALSPDGSHLAISSGVKNTAIQLVDLKSGKLTQTFNGQAGQIGSLTFSPDGQTLASVGQDNTIKFWNLKTASLMQTIPVYTSAIAFSPDNQTVATTSYGGTIRISDLRTGKTLRTLLGHTSYVSSLAFSPDGQILASGGGDAKIKLWNLNTGELLSIFERPYYMVKLLRFGPQGRTLLTTGGFRRGGDQAHIWQVDALPKIKQSEQLLRTLTGHFNVVNFVAITPDRETLVSASLDQTIKLWDTKTGKLRHTIKKVGPAVSYALSPDGQVLATGSYYHSIKLWNLKTGKLLRTLAGNSHEVDALAISPDGKILASGSRFGGPSLAPALGYVAPKDIPCRTSANGCEEIKLWDLNTGRLLQTIRGDSGGVRSLAFSPDGRMLATSSKKIKLWDLNTGKLLHSLNEESNVRSVAFSPDGTTLATGDYNGTILMWDLKTNNPPRILSGNEAPSLFVAFSPDGKMLASSGSSGGAIKIWNLQTQDLPQAIEGNSYQVAALAFSPDSQTIATGGSDKTIKLWRVSP